jgi:hypothetical protein
MIAIFPEIVQCAASGDVERLAILFRKYYGGKQTAAPRPSLTALLGAAGLSVRHLGDAAGRAGAQATAAAPVGALLAKDERGAFTITAVIQGTEEDAATRFLLAHQLGHYLLDIQPLIASGDWQVSGFREEACPLKRYAAGGGGVLPVARSVAP